MGTTNRFSWYTNTFKTPSILFNRYIIPGFTSTWSCFTNIFKFVPPILFCVLQIMFTFQKYMFSSMFHKYFNNTKFSSSFLTSKILFVFHKYFNNFYKYFLSFVNIFSNSTNLFNLIFQASRIFFQVTQIIFASHKYLSKFHKYFFIFYKQFSSSKLIFRV